MKRVLLVTLAMLMAVVVFGCSTTPEASAPATEEPSASAAAEETGQGEEEPAEGKGYVIGFNNYADSHEFAKKVHDNIMEAAEKYGVEIVYKEALMDGQQMISNTEQFIMQGVDLVIDFNWVPEVGATMAEKLAAANIPFISMDTVYDGAYYFGANSHEAGVLIGKHLGECAKDKFGGQVDAVVAMYYMGGGDVVADRANGAFEGLEAVEGITLPGEDMYFMFDIGASDQTANCKTTTQDFLTAHPELEHVVFISSNDESGAGIFAGVEAVGRQDNCLIGSVGADTPFQDHIRQGGGDVWVGSTAFTPEKYGDGVIPMAIDIIDGKEVPEEVYVEHFVITKDNLDEYYPE